LLANLRLSICDFRLTYLNFVKIHKHKFLKFVFFSHPIVSKQNFFEITQRQLNQICAAQLNTVFCGYREVGRMGSRLDDSDTAGEGNDIG